MSASCPVLGFLVIIEPRATVDLSALADDLRRLAHSNGLVVTRRPRELAFEITREGSQATQTDRELLLDWTTRWNRVAAIAISDLEDMNSPSQ